MNIQNLSRQEAFELAEKVNCNNHHLYNITLGHKKPGRKLSQKINKADPRFKLSDLRPDIWGES